MQTADLEVAAHFYADLLGLPISRFRDRELTVAGRIVIRQNSDITKADQRPLGAQPLSIVLYVEPDEFRAIRDRLESERRPWSSSLGRDGVIQTVDIDDNVVEIHRTQ